MRTAERRDISCQPRTSPPWRGVSVQQDLALVLSCTGLTHVERNGHHFIDGMVVGAGRRAGRPLRGPIPIPHDPRRRAARLVIDNGKLALGSLGCPGFAVAADMDFAAMRPMALLLLGAYHPGISREGRMSAALHRFESVAALEDFMTEPCYAGGRSCGRACAVGILVIGVAARWGRRSRAWPACGPGQARDRCGSLLRSRSAAGAGVGGR